MTYTLPTKPAWLSMDSSGLITGTAPSVSSDTNVNLEARVSDGEDATSHAFAVAVKNVLSVSGTLQDSETDGNAAGEIRAYRDNGDGTYTLLKKTTAGSNGAFSMSFSHSGGFDLQARLKSGNDDKSYVRTLPLSSTSTLTGLTIRAVPYEDLSETQTVSATDTIVSIPEFKSFMEDVNKGFVSVSGQGARSGCNANGCSGLMKWNLADDFNGVEILKDNPTSNTGTFTTTQQDYVAGKIAASDDVKLLFDGRTVTVQKDTSANQNANKKYSVSGSTITPDTGWIVVVPVHNLGSSGEVTGGDSDNDGYFEGWRIDLKSNESGIYADGDRVITHEFAHATLYPGGDVAMGHTSRLVNDQSITSTASAGRTACTKPCTFDKKAAKLIYEPTFAVGTPYSEILGTAFHTTN